LSGWEASLEISRNGLNRIARTGQWEERGSIVSEGEFYDCIIVGGGPGGLTAGMYAMRAALKTVCIQKGVPGGQVAITKGVENYPGFIEISGFELCDKFVEHAKWYGLEMIQQDKVEAVICRSPGLPEPAPEKKGIMGRFFGR
jgi:alkyl hydroperoxide reductase subunit AhpF